MNFFHNLLVDDDDDKPPKAHWVFRECPVCEVGQDQPCVLKTGTKRVRRQGIAFLVHEVRPFDLITT